MCPHKTFTTKRAYTRHCRRTKAHTLDRPFRCSICQLSFPRKDVCDRHEARANCHPNAPNGASADRSGLGQRTGEDQAVQVTAPNNQLNEDFGFDFSLESGHGLSNVVPQFTNLLGIQHRPEEDHTDTVQLEPIDWERELNPDFVHAVQPCGADAAIHNPFPEAAVALRTLELPECASTDIVDVLGDGIVASNPDSSLMNEHYGTNTMVAGEAQDLDIGNAMSGPSATIAMQLGTLRPQLTESAQPLVHTHVVFDWDNQGLELDAATSQTANECVRRAVSETLGLAASRGDNRTVLSLLICGADVNQSSTVDGVHHVTPLLRAVMARRTSTVKMLLDHGAGVEHEDSTGRSALAAASHNDDAQIGRLILDLGRFDLHSDDFYRVLTSGFMENRVEFHRMMLQYMPAVDLGESHRVGAP